MTAGSVWCGYKTKISTLARERGYWGLLRFLISRVFVRRFHRAVYEVKTPDAVGLPVWRASEVFFFERPARMEDLPEPIRRCCRDRNASEYVDGSTYVYAVLVDGVAVHSGFVMMRTRETKVLGEPSGTPLIGNCYTAEGSRGRGYYSRALRELTHRLGETGCDRVLIEVDVWNQSSRRGIDKGGFRLHRILSGYIVANAFGFFRIITPQRNHLGAWPVR
jgi:predicted acetyltransferase